MRYSHIKKEGVNHIQELIYKQSALGYSDGELAEILGINLPSLNRMKNGYHYPSTITFARMCIEFNLDRKTIYWLLYELAEEHRTRPIIKRGKK